MFPPAAGKNFFSMTLIYAIMQHGDDMDRNSIEKIAKTPEDRILLARLWDRINSGMRRQIPAATRFLTLREQEMARYLFGNEEGLRSFGGYDGAERKMLVWLPEYLDEQYLYGEDSPVVCMRAEYFRGSTPGHRDFLGALMAAGIERETVGDICVNETFCDFFTTPEIAPYVLDNLLSAGRTALHVSRIPLTKAVIPEPEMQTIRDTVASLRLDSIIASGFRIGRSRAAEFVHAGKVSVDGLPCEKPDRTVTEGSTVSVRGLGKIRLTAVNGNTKKDRVSVSIDKYI